VQTGIAGRARLGALLPAVVAVVVAAAVVIGYLYLHAPRATRVRAGDIAPDFTLPAAGGGAPFRLSRARGGPTFLFFFDSRQDGNESYVDSLQRLNKRFAEQGLTVLGVAFDPEPATLNAFLTRIYVEFPILTDPFAAKLSPVYGPVRDPEAYLIDREGRVVAAFTERVDWRTTEFIGRLEKELPPPGGRREPPSPR
jgi:thioredoxin-dependent peroxiredoxin